jgi:signal transduction histidine kinase/DNA-binding response OmpR family regulator
MIDALFKNPYLSLTERDRARNGYGIIYTLLVLYSIFAFVGDPAPVVAATENPRWTIQLAGFYIGALLGLWAIRTGRLRLAAAMTLLMWFFGSMMNTVAIGFYDSGDTLSMIGLIFIGGLMLDLRGVYLGSVVSLICLAIALFWVRPNFSPEPPGNTAAYHMLLLSLQVIGTAVVTQLFLRYAKIGRQEAIVEIREDRLKLAQMTTRITQRVAERTELSDVLHEAVEQISLNYPLAYHVQIFFVNPQNEIRLVASRGQLGQRLLQENIVLHVGDDSLVGNVAAKGQAIIGLPHDPSTPHRPHELLPETASEFAFPMRAGGNIIGVLDLQSKSPTAFELSDSPIFQSMADSLGIAIENARMFEQERQQRLEMEAVQQVSSNLTRSLDLEDTLANLAQVLFAMVSAHEVGLYLYDSVQDRLHSGMIYQGDIRKRIQRHPRPDGLTYRAARQKETQYIDDRRAHPLYQDDPERWRGFLSALALPLMSGQRVVGVMTIAHPEAAAFPPSKVQVLQILAAQAAIAIENARLFSQEQKRRQIATALTEVARQTNTILELDEVMLVALAELQKIIPYDSAAIHLMQADGTLIVRAGLGFKEEDKAIGSVLHVEDSDLASQLLAEQRPIVVGDVQQEEGWHRSDTRLEVEGYLVIRAWIGAPLIIGGESIGMMTVDKHEPNFYTEEDAETVGNFANQIATAIYSAQLYTYMQHRAEEAETLRQTAMVVASTLDQNAAVELIFQQMIRVVPHDSTSLQLLRGDSLEIVGRRDWLHPENSGQHIGLRFAIPGDNPNTPVIQERRHLILHRVPKQVYADLDRWLDPGILSWMGVPLMVQDQVIGMMSLDSRQENHFTEDHVRLMTAFANQVALAIYNADLYRRTQDYAEDMVKARVAAESANRAKSTFLANMSHELRTPLNAIIGYTDLLMTGIYGPTTEQQNDRLKRVIDNGRHLLGLINDVLDLSKVEAGKMEVYLEDFDLNEVLTAIVTGIRPLAERNQNTLVLDFPPQAGLMHADLTKFRQILLNLLSNACKFTQGGQISFSVQASEDGAWLWFRVADQGIGIKPENMDKLFQEFTQVDASTTRQYGGTGLGLAISRRFALMLGGDITAESQEGQGSIFTLQMPRQVVIQEREAPDARITREVPRDLSAGNLQPSAQNTVLVIDDDPTTADLLEEYLREDGYRVAKAYNAMDGLRLAKELGPAIITLDVILPDLDGWGVLSALKGEETTQHIPIVMLTMMDDKRRGFTLGADDYLIKPINRSQLLTVLKKYSCAHPPCPVLIVEDEAEIRQLFRDTLEAQGWVIAEAENGRVALERVAENRPALILLDLMMPEMDGFQFLQELRKQREWQSIPVVVVTAMDLKPGDRERLNGFVQQILQKGAYQREELLGEVLERVRASVKPASTL